MQSAISLLARAKDIFIDILPGVRRQKKERVPVRKDSDEEESYLDPATQEMLDDLERQTFNMLRGFVRGIYTLPPYSSALYSPMHIWTGICIGDVAGSPYEGKYMMNPKEQVRERMNTPAAQDHFRFTDDSVMSAAVMKATQEMVFAPENKELLQEQIADDRAWKKWIRKVEDSLDPASVYAKKMSEYAKRYPDAGYGSAFYSWAVLGKEGIKGGSYGDGSAMRSGTIGAFFDDLRKVITFAYFSAVPTHSHQEGVKGAVVTAVAVWMAAHGYSREAIVRYAGTQYSKKQYMPFASMTLPGMIKSVSPDFKLLSVSCQVAVPEAFVALGASKDYESALSNVLRFSCDTDTVMAITGAVAAALYGKIEYQGISGAKYLEMKGALKILSEN